MGLNWTDYLQSAKIRAAEEADTHNYLWSEEEILEVQEQAKPFVQKHPEPFLKRRAELLALTAKSAETLREIRAPKVFSWIKVVSLLAAFVLGVLLMKSGANGTWNLLSWPLWSLLGWNALVYMVSLVFPKIAGALPRALQTCFTGGAQKSEALEKVDEENLFDRIEAGFRRILYPTLEIRFFYKSRQWLHLASMVIVLGFMASLLWRSFDENFQVVWQSEWLNASAVKALLGVVLSPAAWLAGISIPFSAIEGMQISGMEGASAPGQAQPWMSLVAFTLGLFIVLPRTFLAIWSQWKTSRAHYGFLEESGWQAYFKRIIASRDGEGEKALVIAYGSPLDHLPITWLRFSIKQHWQDVGSIHLHVVSYGRDFSEDLPKFALAKRCVVVFNMAQTPEIEVHHHWLESFSKELKSRYDTSELRVILSDDGLRKRWGTYTDGGEKLRARHLGWERCLKGIDFEWMALDPKF